MSTLSDQQRAWLKRHHEDGQAILLAFEALERHDQAATQDAVFFRGRMVDAEARVALLQEFWEAFAVVEEGIADFDLHNDAVMRLRAAQEALYGSGAAGPANEASRALPAAADSAAPEKPWGPDHPSYDEMGQ